MQKTTAYFYPSIILLCGLLIGCKQPPTLVHLTGPTMGTSYNVKYASVAGVESKQLQARIDSELLRINTLMSTYDPDSELSKFNQQKTTLPISLSEDTMLVLKEAMRIGQLSNGYLDITVGPMVNLWGFGPAAKPDKIPTIAQITAIKESVGLDKLTISQTTAQKGHVDMYVDLSTVAKGYAVDKVAEILLQLEVSHFLVEIGGEMRAAGNKPDGSDWRIAVEKPVTMERAVHKVITVGNNAIATAGDYRNYFEDNGLRYSHLIDPKTGFPIQHNLVSVTVVHPSSLVADGLATAINVMGREAGFEMALQNDLAVMLITRENDGFKEYTTPRFEPFIKQ